ncbi:Cationic peroxidase 2 precursor [Hibiscus syriacus]|uniref:Cationic peroxidase 2 n=1 Tax=Hibiscus syriacus TaxID=106335 RepID=A0A6A3A4G3_HIBSY|nr:Cationic peroxidase 2 precursor [Hibiscus syriacus]
MGSLLFPKYLLLATLFSLYRTSISQYEQERDVLYTLKHTFNDPFLNDNWNGLQCYGNTSYWFGIQCINGRVTSILLENRGLSGKPSTNSFVVLSELISVVFKNNSLSGNIMDFSFNLKLKHIDLSENMFDGPIPRSLLELELLESLQLQENNLSGTIPEFNQDSLTIFNVSNNHISGPIPGTRTLKSFGFASYFNNGPDMCDSSSSGSCHFSDAHTGRDSKGKSIATIAMVFVIIGLATVILLLILYGKKSRRIKDLMKSYPFEERDDLKLEDDDVHGDEKKLVFMADEECCFDLKDLLRASAEGLGKGVCGHTYKATMENRKPVVVKHFRELKPLSNEEFLKLVRKIADQKHPNLLPLMAYYCSKDEKLFVYRYVRNGNLFNCLHGGRRSKDRIRFSWSSRLTVARSVARALDYLHLNSNHSQNTVPHGNLKSSNILLDDDDTVLVSDHGLTSFMTFPMAAQLMVSYNSPEYQFSERVSRKSDVWSYGCLLLELLTGRVSVHSAPPGIDGVDLSKWVQRAVREGWVAEIFDTEISVEKNAGPGMMKLFEIALRCCDESPENGLR